TRMQIEATALAQETSHDSRERLQKLRKEIADREEEVNRLKAQWQSEKAALEGLRPLTEEIDSLRTQYDQAFKQAQRTNLNADFITAHQAEQKLRAAEKKLQELEKRAAETSEAGPRMLREEVTAEDIAKVVSSWTNIPVSRMLQGEREKLLKM